MNDEFYYMLMCTAWLTLTVLCHGSVVQMRSQREIIEVLNANQVFNKQVSQGLSTLLSNSTCMANRETHQRIEREIDGGGSK